LYQLALRQEIARGKEYRYFIFADDDIQLTGKALNMTNPIDEFYSFLRDALPAIGVGRYRSINFEWERVVSTCYFDAILNAFHRDIVDLLLPYTEMFDARTWWISQLVLERKACALLAGHVLRLPTLRVTNLDHREYERNFHWLTKDADLDGLRRALYSLPPRFHRCLASTLFDTRLLYLEPMLSDSIVQCRRVSPTDAAAYYRALRFNATFQPCQRSTFYVLGDNDDDTAQSASIIDNSLPQPSRLNLSAFIEVPVPGGGATERHTVLRQRPDRSYRCKQRPSLGAFSMLPFDKHARSFVPDVPRQKSNEDIW
jgi:hypothetical protein